MAKGGLVTLAGRGPGFFEPRGRSFAGVGPDLHGHARTSRTACVTPKTSRQARADGGSIDVTTPGPNVLAMAMSGSVAANAFLGPHLHGHRDVSP